MKVVILAGGLGTRISEYTRFIPKPMIKIKRLPILVHIMKHYSKFGFNEFIIAVGYKGNIIKNYFPPTISVLSNILRIVGFSISGILLFVSIINLHILHPSYIFQRHNFVVPSELPVTKMGAVG